MLTKDVQGMIPSSRADTILHYDSRCYSGQFSDDGNFFFSCAQDFKVRMYDASNPYDWKYYKTVNYYSGRWTITDASLSPDNKYLAYSSISSTVSLAATDPNDESEPTRLNFTDMADQRSRGQLGGYSDFGVRFHPSYLFTTN
jgi:WD repeat-containing protein 23